MTVHVTEHSLSTRELVVRGDGAAREEVVVLARRGTGASKIFLIRCRLPPGAVEATTHPEAVVPLSSNRNTIIFSGEKGIGSR